MLKTVRDMGVEGGGHIMLRVQDTVNISPKACKYCMLTRANIHTVNALSAVYCFGCEGIGENKRGLKETGEG